jgi:hypothetical protein
MRSGVLTAVSTTTLFLRVLTPCTFVGTHTSVLEKHTVCVFRAEPRVHIPSATSLCTVSPNVTKDELPANEFISLNSWPQLFNVCESMLTGVLDVWMPKERRDPWCCQMTKPMRLDNVFNLEQRQLYDYTKLCKSLGWHNCSVAANSLFVMNFMKLWQRKFWWELFMTCMLCASLLFPLWVI